MSKRCPCGEPPMKTTGRKTLTKAPEMGDADTSAVEIEGADMATDAAGVGDASSGEQQPTEPLPPGHFVGDDGRIYRRVHVQRGGGWIDYTELAD